MKLQQKQTSSKNLGVAALKALRAYPESEVVKKKIEKWGKFVSAVSERYGKTRDKQQRTKREARNWPKDGYDAIRKLAERLGKEPVVQQALQKAPARISFTELWKLGRWVTFVFYSRHALRGDLADLQIRKRAKLPVQEIGTLARARGRSQDREKSRRDRAQTPRRREQRPQQVHAVRKGKDRSRLPAKHEALREQDAQAGHDAHDPRDYRAVPRETHRHPDAARPQDHCAPQRHR